jgi:hypothetical protein
VKIWKEWKRKRVDNLLWQGGHPAQASVTIATFSDPSQPSSPYVPFFPLG